MPGSEDSLECPTCATVVDRDPDEDDGRSRSDGVADVLLSGL
ncbi:MULTISPECIES: hypothetical protein [Natrialbaceae]|nr:hypothetical protein [Natronococcus sp. CG52]